MKTIPIPQRKNSVTKSFKTIIPPAPHVNLTINHNLTSVKRKSKKSHKQKIVTKIADTDNRSDVIISNIGTGSTDNQIKEKITLTPIETLTQVNSKKISTNLKQIPEKTITDKRTFVSWPRQIKRKKIQINELNSDDNNTPFNTDELATLDEFESVSKANGIKSLSHYSGKKQVIRRRRQIDPTTCERNYTVEEVEFMNAISEYKRSSGRMFPTCSEILEVLKNLGYEKIK
ncbi:MAG: hypothetical protein LBE18_09065 [Planctomycetaceae bacterium]|jgi:hypothetical protein|nr:hypothetical protein [Planctomycetaceae bacterium]